MENSSMASLSMPVSSSPRVMLSSQMLCPRLDSNSVAFIGSPRFKSDYQARLSQVFHHSGATLSSLPHNLNVAHVLYGMAHGANLQISLAYSAIVRSLENLPELAMFIMAFSA